MLNRETSIALTFLVIAGSGCIGPNVEPYEWGVGGEDFGFPDPVGDTTWGGGTRAYSGPGAAAMDIVAVRLYDGANHLEFHLELRDLNAHQEHKNEPDFHAQYALNFIVDEEAPGYSARATYSGTDRARSGGDAWRFQLHDQQADEWPEVTAAIEASTIKWQIPLGIFGAQQGDRLTDWSVSTWASMDNKDQYGDRASSHKTFVVGSGTD